MNDVIVALSTTMGVGALNVIKLSGKDCIKVVNSIFKGKDLTKVDANTINYGFIVDKNEKVDEVLVSIFKSPKSYTREDIVEINCHGGIGATNKIMQLCLENGARLAEPGEFIKRAFLNGRVDLLEAESVSDMISAKTEMSRKLSMAGIDGSLSSLIKSINQDIIELLANIEVNIDYPEYDDALVITEELLKEKCNKIEIRIRNLLDTSKSGKTIKNGVNVGIIGSPNVGKSSILNKLIEENKAIVTSIPGTTRDIVEGSIILSGIEVHLTDTAGIRNTTDEVEKIGVEKSLDILKESDLILFIFDINKKATKEEIKLLNKCVKEKTIIILNKVDLESNFDKNILKDYEIIEISALNDQDFTNLKNKIIERFKIKDINQDFTYLSNARHIALMKKAYKIIKEINDEINNKVTVDLIEISLRELADTLGQITGTSYKEDLINEIFSKFCLGK